jgi:hypothetical protein
VASHEEIRAGLPAFIESTEAETREAAAFPEVDEQRGRFALAVERSMRTRASAWPARSSTTSRAAPDVPHVHRCSASTSPE